MSVQFKFRENVEHDKRLEIIEALAQAGFSAKSLFPGQTRPKLASIYSVSEADAKDIKSLKATLTGFGKAIEYVEASPQRKLKG